MDSAEAKVETTEQPQIKPILHIGVICGKGVTAVALERGLHEEEKNPVYLVKLLTQAINSIVSHPPKKQPESGIVKPGINAMRQFAGEKR